MNKEETDMIEYRVNKLEEAVLSINILKETILRIETKLQANDGFLQCPMHKIKMDNFEQKLNKMEDMVISLDRFKWKSVGVLSVIIILLQLFGSTIVEKTLSNRSKIDKISIVSPSTNSNFYGNYTIKY